MTWHGSAPPESEAELLARAEQLAGRTLGDVAVEVDVPVPPDLRRAKGWVGQLVERVLGADAASRDEPDFRRIGVELKTLPVDGAGRPVETTFVATIPLDQVGDVPWEGSRVERKLRRVLWVPVDGRRAMPVAERRIGAALLWSPDPEQEAALRYDWEELSGLIGRGEMEAITAHLGRYLQVRPKAAHSRIRRTAIDAEGLVTETLPRGFYLRTCFTADLLRRHYRL